LERLPECSEGYSFEQAVPNGRVIDASGKTARVPPAIARQRLDAGKPHTSPVSPDASTESPARSFNLLRVAFPLSKEHELVNNKYAIIRPSDGAAAIAQAVDFPGTVIPEESVNGDFHAGL
jgi:hypothetical protein